MLTLSRLVLTDFRNYDSLTWRPASRIAVLTGANGAGKTNLLEAISLMAPGRGLRGARIAEFSRIGGPGPWAVAAQFSGGAEKFDIGTGTLPGAPDRRVFRLDGAEPRSQAEIGGRVAAIWLTPQMDTLFAESASGRRRFLDRLAWALEPDHARQASAYETAMAGRNRLLAAGGADPSWLAGLEDSMARHATALAAARAGFVARLNQAKLASAAFPRARMMLLDPIAERLANTPALAVEDWLRAEFYARRAQDAAAGGASIGAHRADMRLEDAATALSAAQASTGQRKALLVGIILAHAALIAEARGFAPLLLLDEPAVHLDEARRAGLFDALSNLTAQAMLTGTDAAIFAPLRQTAEFLRVDDGKLR